MAINLDVVQRKEQPLGLRSNLLASGHDVERRGDLRARSRLLSDTGVHVAEE